MESNLVPRQGELLGNSVSHQSGTDNRNVLDPRMIHGWPLPPAMTV